MLTKKGCVLLGILTAIVVLIAYANTIIPDGGGQNLPFVFSEFLHNVGMTIVGLFAMVAVFFVYFLPSFNASYRKHNNVPAITALNLFLGWTFLGWIAAFVWSFTDNTRNVDSNTKSLS